MYRGEAVAMGCCLDIVCLVHNVQVWFCILLRVCVCVFASKWVVVWTCWLYLCARIWCELLCSLFTVVVFLLVLICIS